MTGLVNYSDSEEDIVNCFEKNARHSLKRKEINGTSDSFSFSITKKNILKLPRINKEYGSDEIKETDTSNCNEEKKDIGFSSFIPAPKNNLKVARMSKNNGMKKFTEYSQTPCLEKKDEGKECFSTSSEDVQSKVCFFSLNIEKPNVNEYEQMRSDSSSYAPMFVKKEDYLALKKKNDVDNTELNKKITQNIHCSELYRIDEDQDLLEHTYSLVEEKEIPFKEKDIESVMRIYGKRRKDKGPINFLEINAEDEYNTNEIMKKQGLLAEAPQPIRSIGAGRHQITTLLNSAISQREVFEESFAANKETRRQSGRKYGF
ncbi:hypothetical protein PORY_000654 [Pneumocystis oryctolagi]|uniref:Uncharacterized protein n=1 Tax=Pneumocystis oryctolagi TaxID=42067 RepID=A0ACB7CFR8_9ASCO|nr:hypothetical protein PORY_000654 [Pneumocystis oryctolagi]